MTFILPVEPEEKSSNEERTRHQPRKCDRVFITAYLILLWVLVLLTFNFLLPLISEKYNAEKVEIPKHVHKRSLDVSSESPEFYGHNVTEFLAGFYAIVAVHEEDEIESPKFVLRVHRGVKQAKESSGSNLVQVNSTKVFQGVIQLQPVPSTQPDRRQPRRVRILRNALMGLALNSSFPGSAVANAQHDERQSRMGKAYGNAQMKAIFINASFPGSANTSELDADVQRQRSIFFGFRGAFSGVAKKQEKEPNLLRIRRDTSELHDDVHRPRYIVISDDGDYPVTMKQENEPILLRIHRDTKKIKEKKEDVYEPFVVTDSSPCKPPTGLKTAEVLCKIWPRNTICISYCAYGKTFDEGIKRVHACTHNENRWSKNFEECKPFVDCKLRLIAPGSLQCKGNQLTDSPSCTVSCDRYEDHEEVNSTTYQCKTDGSWQPKLPLCVSPTGTPLVISPEVKEHVDIAYPEVPKKT